MDFTRYIVGGFFVGATAWAEPAVSGDQAKRFLPIPLAAPAQEMSSAMISLLRALQDEKALERLDRWQRLAELPAWAFEPKKREIAYLPPRSLLIHDYRYAVLAHADGEVLVVRAGGQSDSYDYFLKSRPQPRKEADSETTRGTAAGAEDRSNEAPTPPA